MPVAKTFFKTPREIELEAHVARLEIALQRAHHKGLDMGEYFVPPTAEMHMDIAPPKLDRAVVIQAKYDHKHMPNHLMVAANVWTKEPFALNYYCDLHLLTDVKIATQVLAMQHARFVHQLADFIQKEHDTAKKRSSTWPGSVDSGH